MKVELLSPVGDLAMCYAAVHNGADAIYVGVPEWNARGRSADLGLDDLRDMIRFCRLRGVKVYFALNVLVFERELRELSEDLATWISLCPDAFIVQDVGLARLIRAVAPTQEIHASTQMTLASAEALSLVAELGFGRCVLARELSIAQIRRIHESIPTMELEVFVHGALCVSYSGQCLTSESFGGRSANRGQCAQSCRLPYRLIVDGVERNIGGRNYLFSPQDLCALGEIDDLLAAGVASLKIEGRLKSPEYVAAVTAAYRAAVDGGQVPSSTRAALEALFSRGLFTGWLRGVNHQKLVNGFYSSHHGARLGTVTKVAGSNVWVRTDLECLPGDGVVFSSSCGEGSTGGRVYAVTREKGLLKLEFARDFDLRSVDSKFEAFRNDSPAIEKEVRRSFTDKENFRRIPVRMTLSGRESEPLRLVMQDENGHCVEAQSTENLEEARTPRTNNIGLAEECAALSGTAYSCSEPVVQVASTAFVNAKAVRQLRQEVVALLDVQRLAWRELRPDAKEGEALLARIKCVGPFKQAPTLSVLVRRQEQLAGLTGLPLESVILDLDYGKDLQSALDETRALGFRAGFATLRVHKAGENHTLRTIRDLAPDLVLVRSLGALAYFRNSGCEMRGDYSLNACNRLTMDWLLGQGLSCVHPSWDLNQEQLFDLADAIGGGALEVALHQYMPTFHIEHCVFAAFLSEGERFPFCGRVF